MTGRRPVAALVRRGEAILDDVAQRSRESLGTRVRRLGRTLLPIVQSAVAAGLAWYVATRFVGHPQPFFAPIAAVLSLGVSLGQRLRRSLELVVGVALGVLVAELLIGAIGRGAWQIGLVVLLAMAAAVLTGGGPLLVNQGAASAILVVALVPATSTAMAATTRFVDALVGGAIGLLVNAILLPVNPVVVARRAAGRMLEELASTLDDLASALNAKDRSAANAALARARLIEGSFGDFREALSAGREIARIAPVRWRARGHLTSYVDAVTDLDHAVRNTRVLARRVIVVIRDDEPVPPNLVASVRRLAESVRTLRNELARGVEPRAARRGLVDAAELATSAVDACGFSGKVVVAQVRSCVHDLLHASGLDRADVDEILAGIDDVG
ncbi:FUSC family protein [Actinopolymorpha sp. B11F2]|uniref:FUSC family protein n=1 Tax=Actinopolymorpha sp. B11F2 TaxID=3160862 RepID=UPI0032E37C34